MITSKIGLFLKLCLRQAMFHNILQSERFGLFQNQLFTFFQQLYYHLSYFFLINLLVSTTKQDHLKSVMRNLSTRA